MLTSFRVKDVESITGTYITHSGASAELSELVSTVGVLVPIAGTGEYSGGVGAYCRNW